MKESICQCLQPFLNGAGDFCTKCSCDYFGHVMVQMLQKEIRGLIKVLSMFVFCIGFSQADSVSVVDSNRKIIPFYKNNVEYLKLPENEIYDALRFYEKDTIYILKRENGKDKECMRTRLRFSRSTKIKRRF